MFQIRKAFENATIVLLSIEGEITDRYLDDWSEALATINVKAKKQIILDFCEVSYISRNAVGTLLGQITEKMFLLNCRMPLKNMLHSVGLTEKVLN